MPPEGFVCKRCGNCCMNFNDAFEGHATPSDVMVWQRHKGNILAWVDAFEHSNGGMGGDVRISPRIHGGVKRCPHVRKIPRQNKYKCRIDIIMPSFCQAYPKTKEHALKTGCKGFDP